MLAAVAALIVYLMSARALAHRRRRFAPRQAEAAQLADGQRQLHVLGCVNCHGPKLQGDIFIDEPELARVYAHLTLVAAKAVTPSSTRHPAGHRP